MSATASDPKPRARSLTIATSTVFAWLALALAVATLVILSIPVSNAPIQECGAPGLYLLRGTPDASLYDSAGQPKGGLDHDGLQRAFDNRCSRKVGREAWPAAVTGAGFIVLSLFALTLALLGHRAERRSTSDQA